MGENDLTDISAPRGGLAPPALPEICAPRHRLLNRYYRAADKRLTFVRAPAGCGKSLSTALWLADCGRAAVWFGLNGRDNDPVRFYQMFGTGLISLQPDNSALANILRNPAFASSPVEHALRLARELARAWAPDTRRPVLVFDDIHLTNSGEIRQSLPVVLRELPPFFSIFLLSRNEAPERTGMAGASGPDTETALLTKDDLAFEPEEIRAYFAARRVGLSETEAVSIFDLTRGWAMGINVMAAVGRSALDMKGGRSLAEYLTTRIWKKWSRELRDFMLKTAVPDAFSVATAELLTGRKNCDKILEKLCAENLFIVSLGNGMYHYQSLFLDFLRSRRRERARIDFPALHKVLALDCLEKGEDAIALRHALLSGDDACITAATGNVFQYSAACTDVSAFAEVFRLHFTENPGEKVGAAVLEKRPYLLALLAWYHYLAGDARSFLAFLDALYARLPDIRTGHREFQEGCAMLATLDPRLPPTGKSGELLTELAADTRPGSESRNGTEPAIQSASLSQNLPFMHRSNRDYSVYATDIDANMAVFDATFRPYLREDYQPIEAMLRAGLAYEQNRPGEALEHAGRAFAAMTERTAPELRFSAFMIQAVALCALRHNDRAREVFAATRRMLEKHRAHYLFPNLHAVETKLLLAEGDSAAAANWLGKFLVDEGGPVELYKSPRHFATARAHIVLGDLEKAGTILHGLREMGRDFARPLDMAEAGALLAIVRWREQKIGEAVKLLETALETVQDHECIRIFADEGAALLPVLKKVAARVAKTGYARTLNVHFVRAVIEATRDKTASRAGLAFPESGKGVNLSRRQREILALLARGHSQAEIELETGLAIPTIKSHCAAIYGKLGVNNARDALTRARALGLAEAKEPSRRKGKASRG